MTQESAQPLSNQAPQESGKHIVTALVIAAFIVFGARLLTDSLAHRNAPTAAVPASQPASAASDKATEDERMAAEARRARQQREQAIIDEERARREQKKADVMRARDEAVAQAQAEEARKEAAWQRYFTPQKKCNTATDDATRVDCGNQFMRAKERFEKLYADGKVR